MKQSAAVRPDPSFQRKAAIAQGAALDHSGLVSVDPIPNFDLNRTIFNTLEGKAARYVMATRVGKEAHWKDEAAKKVQAAYDAARAEHPLPEVDAELLKFMVEECDFDVEHADGSFLDHLYFGFEYAVIHYPQHSPLVMLLHSILGTGTNTFAMTADKIPGLQALMDPFDWRHVEAFPSILRLLYDIPLRTELHDILATPGKIETLEAISCRRVIDNAPIRLSAEDFWIQLNYQLIHLVDFLPVANWAAHQNETSFIIFRDLYDILKKAGQLQAHVDYQPAGSGRVLAGEKQSIGSWLTTLIPVGVSEKMAAGSVRRFSERIGHSIGYELHWK